MVSWVVIQLCSVSASLPVTFTLGQADDWELWTVNTTHCCQCNLLLGRLTMTESSQSSVQCTTPHTLAKVKPAPFKEVQSCSHRPPYLAQLNIFILTMLCQMAYNTQYSDVIQYSILRFHTMLSVGNLIMYGKIYVRYTIIDIRCMRTQTIRSV